MPTLQTRSTTRAPARRVTTVSQPVRNLSLADPEAADDLAAFRAEIYKSPETARAFLHQVGILTRTGRLSRRYGGR